MRITSVSCGLSLLTGGRPEDGETMDKTAWTVVRRPEMDADAFERLVVHELPAAARTLLPSVDTMTVTLQDPSAYSSASVVVADGERPVDAVLEITALEDDTPLDDFLELLLDETAQVQGWRVHPTTIFDTSAPTDPGEASRFPNLMIFVQRLDGTSREHFSRNWYIHGGHLDGEASEDAAAGRERQAREKAGAGRRYVQNRVVEALTPTSWVVDGYTQLHMAALVPAVGEKNPRRPEEDPFERWPPRILQGSEYRIL
jgi:hypothetical protein